MPNEPKRKRSRRIRHEQKKVLRRVVVWGILIALVIAFCIASFIIMDHLNSAPSYNSVY
jgi:hypothetical protein